MIIFPMNRITYWKWVALMFGGYFLIGLTGNFNENTAGLLTLVGAFITIYLGASRCKDIGWHPFFGIFAVVFLGLIIIGIPKSKQEELRLF